LKTLGEGGFGAVYLAEEELVGRHVAIKLLKVENPDDQNGLIIEMQSLYPFSTKHRRFLSPFRPGAALIPCHYFRSERSILEKTNKIGLTRTTPIFQFRRSRLYDY